MANLRVFGSVLHGTAKDGSDLDLLVDFGKANPIDKARQQPDKVRMVLDRGKRVASPIKGERRVAAAGVTALAPSKQAFNP